MRHFSSILLAVTLSVGATAQPSGLMLNKDMPGKSFSGPLPPLTARQTALKQRLQADVQQLAVTIGERNSLHYAKLNQARDWMAAQLGAAGYKVRTQSYTALGKTYTNLECEQPGLSSNTVVIGAHYDSAVGTPAANDNASGCAALLALARRFHGKKLNQTVRFAAFVNEEPPYFVRDTMGSLVYARHCQQRGDKLSAMLSLETIGYYSDTPNSQRYPTGATTLDPSLPKTGNFIGFVSNTGSGALVKRCVGAFRKSARFPSMGAALPGQLEGVGWSDHWSFWQIGVPSVMVTDTAPFRYNHYHQASDTPDKINFDRMARVVQGLETVVEELAR